MTIGRFALLRKMNYQTLGANHLNIALNGPGIVIAASDSLQQHKRQAHLTCDGTKDEEQIQQAIDDVGGNIIFMPGTYLLDQNDSNDYCLLVDLTAGKPHVAFYFHAGAILKINALQYVDGETVHLIRGEGKTADESSFTLWGPGILDGNLANNGRESGIGTEEHKGLAFNNILNTALTIGGGILFRNIDGQAMKLIGNNNVTRSVLLNGIRVWDCGEGMLIVRCFDSNATNISVENMDKQDGIELLFCHRFSLTNSTVRRCFDDCFDLVASASGGQNTFGYVISGCHFGPRLDTSTSTNKEIVSLNNGSSGFILENVSFVGNTIDMDGDDTLNGIVIGPLQGSPPDAGAITRNILISGNTINGAGSAVGADGIAVDAIATQIAILNNLVNNCPGDAITLADNPNEIHIKGNSGWGNGGGVVIGSGTGIINTNNDFI